MNNRNLPNDIAPDFRRLIRKLPTEHLLEMKGEFVAKLRDAGAGSVAEKVELDLKVELLRRKWQGIAA